MWYRQNYQLPDILGQWKCQWFDDEKTQDEPLVEDVLEIDRWTADGEFVASGVQEQRNLVYPLVGEIDPSRIVTLTYKAAHYPYEPNRGIVLLELSRDGGTMQGRWFGKRFSGRLGGGRVVCTRITDDKVPSAA